MLYTFLYHQVNAQIETHLTYFKQKGPIVLPGEPLNSSLMICLTFDDATVDFYDIVFPLLQKYQIRALLAVPVKLIDSPGYCSWNQLKVMADSGLVEFASHSMYHKNLLSLSKPELVYELKKSKKTLQDRLGVSIHTFVYPFGKFDQTVHRYAQQDYKFIMRIGSCWNRNWQNFSRVIYRIVTDPSHRPESLFHVHRKVAYLILYVLNSIRKR